jgi:hypothetical protein
MAQFKSFPQDMPEWQAIQDSFNQRREGDVPYAEGMAPQEPTIPSNYMQKAVEEANNQPIVDPVQDLSGPVESGVVESGQVTQSEFDQARGNAPMLSKREQMLEEYMKLAGRDREELADARKKDRWLKMGGAIGDALATIVNAQGQKNVMAPGVQVQQGAGLGKVADMFQTSGDVKDDIKSRREDLLAQYKALSDSGELTPYQKQFLALKEKDQKLREQQLGDVMERHGENLEFKTTKEGQLSDKIATSFADINSAKAEAEKLLPTVDNVGLGVIGTPILKARSAIGLPDKDYQKLESDYAGIRNTIRNALFGSALTGPEIKAFEQELNDISISQEGFKDNLNNFIARAERRMAERAEALGKAQPMKAKALEQFTNKTEKDPRVQKYADQHFGGDYNKAEALLKKRGDI